MGIVERVAPVPDQIAAAAEDHRRQPAGIPIVEKTQAAIPVGGTTEWLIACLPAHTGELFPGLRRAVVTQFLQPVDVVIQNLERAVGRKADLRPVGGAILFHEGGHVIVEFLRLQPPLRRADIAIQVDETPGLVVEQGLILVGDDQVRQRSSLQPGQHLVVDIAVAPRILALHGYSVPVRAVELGDQGLQRLLALLGMLVPENELYRLRLDAVRVDLDECGSVTPAAAGEEPPQCDQTRRQPPDAPLAPC